MNQPATTLDRLVAKASRLYTLPAVAIEVLELTADPTVDTWALKACIENDPALSTKLLRVVNSSLFGLTRHVSDLNQALALLGVKPLKLLVLGFSLPGRLFQGLAGEVLSQYWRHTLTKAVAAREIAAAVRRQSGDEAFIAGLLQDLGSLLLIQELGEPYVELLRKARTEATDLLDCERRSLGFDHTTLTASILERWRLPELLVAAVEVTGGRQVNPSNMVADLRQVLHLAEMVARLLADGDTTILGEILARGKQLCGLAPVRLEALMGTIEEKVCQLADVFCLPLPEGTDFGDILARAHQSLGEVAYEAAAEMLADRQLQSVVVEPISPRCDAAMLVTPQPGAACRSSAAVAEPKTFSRPKAAPSATCRSAEPDPGLIEQISVAVGLCRQSRSPLSLLLLEPADAPQLFLTLGSQGYERFRCFLEAVCRNLDTAAQCLPRDEAGFAVVLPGCERQRAVQLGNELIAQLRCLPPRPAAIDPRAASLAVGAATLSLPPRNFPSEELFKAAARCLYGSRLSGGGVVKSIEIY
ncbi:MAG: HDOD domain-containing protein [Rhodopirellula sp.]|nr:HDOD domain-containing protein [Rhodopirellula sp.]